ncbi:hypothetical protein HJG60_001792 [Phyllostomus discolor]|uniref:Uncharacterized protein C20orf96 homolog isoform X2 n=1 Tax=Phyllostomus discolor TaxID=89673 RepID=A0A7E6CF18_9CHIR|nr:uncharacterized protein C20orf96 homolog isoform X2 [Phyllostomus discolor]KAF6087496.1 hypothetical protein HJG60_001792 [Phyllostomus discolor]
MASVFPKPFHSGSRSTDNKFPILDCGPWQQPKPKVKTSTTLPVLQTSGPKKSKMKTWISIQPGYSKPTMLRTGQLRNPQEPLGKRLDSAKAKFRLLKVMLRNRQISLQELRNQEDFLTKFNQDLIKTIQDMEDSSARKMRSMLQQQNVFGTIVHLLAYSNEKKLQQMKCELQEWKENEDSKMSYLKQQVEQLSAKIKKTQEEVNFLSTYMDHEYPVKVVRIDNLVHQLQQVKDNQQDELDDLNEMLKKVLESLSQEIQMKRKKLLNSLVVKTQEPCQEVLLQKISENHNMVKHADKFREFTNQFKQEIPKLRAEVGQLRAQVQDPREIVFADILLRRPKCTPDMDVTLNIPVEELLPF